MKNRKINLDRPRIDSNEIQSHMDFNRVLENFNIMSRPFYKSTWFLGTTGLASLGLIIGGTIAFQDPNSHEVDRNLANTDAPPDLTVPDNSLIALNANFNDVTADLAKETLKLYSHNLNNTNNEEIYEDNSTLENNATNNTNENSENNADETVTDITDPTEVVVDDRNGFSRLDLNPKICGKLDGGITREELLDSRGITTGGNISIVHFELYLIDGLDGQVFVEDGNQLNEEMKSAIERVLIGETIFFENIRGKSKSGDIVRLNPLRYTLLN